MPGSAPLIRQWLILRLLAARPPGITLREIAEEMEVSEKTIGRDLATFREAGFPVEEETGSRGRKTWRLCKDGKDDLPLGFAFDEALALYLGRRFLEPLAGTMLWEAAQNAFRKIEVCLGPTARRYLDQMAAALHVTSPGAGNYAVKSEIIDALQRGIEEHKTTHIVYQSARSTEPVTYEISPYGMAIHRDSLYLVAESREHGQVRHFKVDRIEEAEVSKFPFRMPEDFSVQEHLAGSFGIFGGQQNVTVKIRFSPEVARYVQESHWHASEELTSQRDGSILAQFQLSSTEEVKSWALSFGQHAEVLEPGGLREEMTAELESALKRYHPARKINTPRRAES